MMAIEARLRDMANPARGEPANASVRLAMTYLSVRAGLREIMVSPMPNAAAHILRPDPACFPAPSR
jgi:hypothetical protein